MTGPDDVPDADDSSISRPFERLMTERSQERRARYRNQIAKMLRDMNRPTADAVPDADDSSVNQ